jgi:hypothetical protein
MIPAPRYTDPARVKAAGSDSNPIEPLAHRALPSADNGAFFSPASMVDRAEQPHGWPAPVSGSSNSARPAAHSNGRRFPASTLVSAMPTAMNPLLQKAADAINNVYFLGRHHSLRSAIDERLSLTTGLAEHLAESFDNAAHFRAKLDYRNLYSAMTLLHRELQAIDALWNVMCEDVAPKATTPQTA